MNPPGSMRRPAGFTLVELITVIIILGVIAAVAVPRLMQNDSQERATAGQLLGSLRQAQRMAVTHNRDVCVVITANTVRFTMATTAGTGIACNAAALSTVGDSNDTLDVVLAAGASITFTPAGNFRFTPAGSLANNAGVAFAAARNITLVRSGTNFATLNVQPDNGYVLASSF